MAFFHKHRYSKLEDQKSSSSKPPLPFYFYLILGLFITISTNLVTFFATAGTIKSTNPFAPRTLKYTCGNSTTEARALGCSYDPLAGGWLPKECPAHFTEEYLAAAPIEGSFYRDFNRTIPIPTWEEISEVEGLYFATYKQHIVHCGYSIMRLHKLIENGEPLDSSMIPFGHTRVSRHLICSRNSSSFSKDT